MLFSRRRWDRAVLELSARFAEDPFGCADGGVREVELHPASAFAHVSRLVHILPFDIASLCDGYAYGERGAARLRRGSEEDLSVIEIARCGESGRDFSDGIVAASRECRRWKIGFRRYVQPTDDERGEYSCAEYDREYEYWESIPLSFACSHGPSHAAPAVECVYKSCCRGGSEANRVLLVVRAY